MTQLSFPAEMVSAINGGMGLSEYTTLRKQWIERSYTDLKAVWGATYISANAFSQCLKLIEAIIPPTVASAGENAFDGCSNITCMVVPEGFTSIEGICVNCNGLTSLSLPEGLLSILGYTIYATSLPKLVIPSTVTTIASYAIMQRYVACKIYFKGTPTSIGAKAIQLNAGGDIYVPWSEGAVSGAPWGSPSATIHYDYTYTGTEA